RRWDSHINAVWRGAQHCPAAWRLPRRDFVLSIGRRIEGHRAPLAQSRCLWAGKRREPLKEFLLVLGLKVVRLVCAHHYLKHKWKLPQALHGGGELDQLYREASLRLRALLVRRVPRKVAVAQHHILCLPRR